MKKLIIVLITLLFLVSGLLLADELPKAYRDIRFGESRETVNEKVEEDDKIEEDMRDDTVKMGEYNYDLTFDYYKDNLYRVEFTAQINVKEKRDTLVKVIKRTYEEPDYSNKIESSDMEIGKIIWSHIWKLEDKNIKIGIGENYESEYYSVMHIEYLPLLEEKEEAEEKEEEAEEKESEESINESSEDF